MYTHTHTHTHTHTQLIYCWEVELGWQTETNSLWLYFGRKRESVSVALSLFCLSTFVSTISLLSEFATQSVIRLGLPSLIDCCQVQIVCSEISDTDHLQASPCNIISRLTTIFLYIIKCTTNFHIFAIETFPRAKQLTR